MKIKRLTYFISILFAWTILIISLIVFEFYKVQEEMDNDAKMEAHANFNKDQAIRNWASLHGGVYVPVDSTTQPNPALSHIKDRDIESALGKKLTLMNPAYMIRQLNEYFAEYYGVLGHITSKKLMRPENKADDWEFDALTQFEKGVKEVSGYSDIAGEPHLRLMQPMLIKRSCLKCHGHQNYEVGDVRGGVGISIPMKPLLERASHQKERSVFVLGFVWFVGILGLSFGYKSLNSSLTKQENAEKALRKQNKELDKIVEDRTSKLRTQNNEYFLLTEEYKTANKELIIAKEKSEKSESRYKQLSNQFEAILDHIPGLVFFKDKKNNFVKVNKYFADAHKLKKKEFEGKSASAFYPLKDSEKYYNDDLEVINSQKSKLNIEEPWETETGSKWVNTSKIPFVENGKIEGVIGISLDVTERKNFERKMFQVMLNAEEKERAKLAKELHDGLGPLLATSKLYSKALLKVNDPKETEFIISKINETILESLECTHEISNNLSPHILRNFGLTTAIESFYTKLKAVKDIDFDFKSNLDSRIDENVETSLYRISVELIHNSIKHAKAKKINIKINLEKENIYYNYSDNGIGFDVNSTKKESTGMGLTNIESRIKSLDGTIKLSSEKGKGFQLAIVVKLGYPRKLG